MSSKLLNGPNKVYNSHLFSNHLYKDSHEEELMLLLQLSMKFGNDFIVLINFKNLGKVLKVISLQYYK